MAPSANIFSDLRAWTTALTFFMSGTMLGSWSACIPTLKEALHLDEAQLGFILLFLSVGVIVGNPVSVWLMKRIGLAKTAIISAVFAVFAFVLVVMAISVPLSILGLTMAGFLFSTLNVAMNTGASLTEEQAGMRIMSTCHGAWSLGAMTGSGLCSFGLSQGITPLYWMLFVLGISTLVSVFITSSGLHQIKQKRQTLSENDASNSKMIWPTPALWALIVLSICTNLTEGTMTDWAAIFMRDDVGAPVWLEGWGFGVYAFFMAAGRLVGDRLLLIHHPGRLLRFGGLLAASGFMLAVWTQSSIPALIGFGMIGAGVSLGAPILYGAAARTPGLPQGAGLALMNTFAMTGFLAGPAIIGFIARASSLPVAFSLVAAVGMFWAWRSKTLYNLPS